MTDSNPPPDPGDVAFHILMAVREYETADPGDRGDSFGEQQMQKIADRNGWNLREVSLEFDRLYESRLVTGQHVRGFGHETLSLGSCRLTLSGARALGEYLPRLDIIHVG